MRVNKIEHIHFQKKKKKKKKKIQNILIEY